jgi:Leucine-rich repeat (LRR) protein
MPLETLILNTCDLARGFQVLTELKSLKVLSLPDRLWTLPMEELVALSALRQHPTLRQIAVATKNINATGTAAEFWKTWDHDVGCVLALHRNGVKFSTTWWKDGGLSVSIDDPAFKDLAVFHGANLASLTLHGTSVSDLTPLAGLPLKYLQLTRTPVTDLSPIAGLALDELKVKEMQVTDISVLRRAPLCDSLTRLWLEYLKVSDFSPVSACKALRVFSAWQSSMTDLAPLHGLHLENLYIQATQVHDLSPLAGMPLEDIFFDSTPVTDLAPLQNIPTLKYVILPEKAENLEALKKLPNLLRLSFSYDPKVPGPSMTAAEFWSFLDAKTNLMAPLRAAGIKIKAFNPLQDGTWELDLVASTIKDLTVLSGAPISILRLGVTPVTDLSPLRGMPLKKLSIDRTKVTDVSALKDMPLEELFFDFTSVTDITPLLTIPSLKVVMLPEKADNVEALRKLPNLQRISFFWDMKAGRPSMTAAEFWKAWDRELSFVRALQRDGVKFSTHRPSDGGLSVTIEDPAFKDLAVFRGANLASLTLTGTNVSDLTPLAGLPLKNLQLKRNPVTDLSPLAGLALEELRVTEMPVTDISVLSHAPLCDSLTTLLLEELQVTDFSPVAACKALTVFCALSSSIADLAPLRGLRLKTLSVAQTKVHDLSVVAGMPLEELLFDYTSVTDIMPLQNIPTLKTVMLSDKAKDVQILRKLPNLEHISYFWDPNARKPSMTAAQFWKSFDTHNASATRLRDAGIEVKLLKPLEDGTCELSLEASTIKDLTILRGVPISICDLEEHPCPI